MKISMADPVRHYSGALHSLKSPLGYSEEQPAHAELTAG